MVEKYYEEELRYLYESGREFAKAHPDRRSFSMLTQWETATRTWSGCLRALRSFRRASAKTR